jgi:DNA gyrase subunit A
MSNLTPIIKESFIQYAGAVLQSRALVDVRDCLKPSARQIFYCMYTDNFTHNKPFKKTLKAIGSAMRLYIHGDSSCEGVIMRAGQPFAMRYPLIEVEGSYGNLMESGNWAAPRYTSSRLSSLSECLFSDIKKDTIREWRDNYDDTEQYPVVLTGKGFYNIVNGSFGIGIGMASSIPQFNLKEVNEALTKLLWNPDIEFEEIYCPPDFATGGILLNEEEVKESLKSGTGRSCKLRSVIDFDPKEKTLVVTEIPYGVYTNTICQELTAILESDDNPGIDRFNDLTSSKPLIKIYLAKKANPDRVIKYLYKNTSLQSHFGVNMTMLQDGRFPRIFGWKQALQEHLNHERNIYVNGYNFDLNKINKRIHILDGFIIAMANIEEVVQIIKESASKTTANTKLCEVFLLDSEQAEAILDMKLSRLARLEVEKIQNEKIELEKEKSRIEAILKDDSLLKKEIEKGFKEVSNKFGDARKTKILNVESDEENEPIENKSLIVNLTNMNNLFISETSSLYTQKRGTVGTKIKLEKGEYITSSISCETVDSLLVFSQKGNCYSCNLTAIPILEKVAIESFFSIKSYEKICAITSFNKTNSKEHIIFITKNGIMKKSRLEEYNTNRNGGIKAIELEKDDEIISVIFTNTEKIGILSESGQFMICETKDVRPIGRIAKGVKGIKLNPGDFVVSAKSIPANTKEFVSITKNGYIKRTDSKEFTTTGRYTKGVKLQKIKEESDCLIGFLPLFNEEEIVIISTSAQLKIKTTEISLVSRGSVGTKSIKMKDSDSIVEIIKN